MAAAARHLLACDLAPVFDIDAIRALWRRDRELATKLARLAGAA
jgi:hypothetical protein